MTTGHKQTSQRQKFIDKAREIGADDSVAAFERKLTRIAKAGPKAPSKPKKEGNRKC